MHKSYFSNEDAVDHPPFLPYGGQTSCRETAFRSFCQFPRPTENARGNSRYARGYMTACTKYLNAPFDPFQSSKTDARRCSLIEHPWQQKETDRGREKVREREREGGLHRGTKNMHVFAYSVRERVNNAFVSIPETYAARQRAR